MYICVRDIYKNDYTSTAYKDKTLEITTKSTNIMYEVGYIHIMGYIQQ